MYKQKQYRQAFDFLEAHKNEIDPLLYHFNMSNVLIGLDNMPKARFHLLKAESISSYEKSFYPLKEKIDESLDLERLESAVTAQDYFYKTFLALQGQGFLSLSLIFLICGLFIIKKVKTLKIWFVLSLIVMTPSLLNLWVNNWSKYISNEEIKLSSGPSAVFLTERSIPSGILLIGKDYDGWLKIQYPSRFQGWVKKSQILRVN